MAEASTITDNGAFIRGCSNNVAAHKASFDERTASVQIQGLKVELRESVSGFKTLRLMARNDDKNLLFFYSFNMLLERKDSGRGHPVTEGCGLWSPPLALLVAAVPQTSGQFVCLRRGSKFEVTTVMTEDTLPFMY